MKHGFQSNLNQYNLNPRSWILKMAPEETISYFSLNKNQDIFWFSVYIQFLIQIRHQSDKNAQRLWGETWAGIWAFFHNGLTAFALFSLSFCPIWMWNWLALFDSGSGCDLLPMLSRLMVYTGDSDCYPSREVWAVIRGLDWMKWGKQPASVL